MQWAQLSADAVFLACYVAEAVLILGWIRRHDDSLRLLFWLYGISLIARAIHHVFVATIWAKYQFEGDEWWLTWLLITKAICALTFLPTVALLAWLTPSVMRIPNIKQLGERLDQQLQRVGQLEARLTSKEHLALTDAEHRLRETQTKLAEALATIKTLRGE